MVSRIVSGITFALLSLSLLIGSAAAQTTYTSIGMAGGGEFFFGHLPDGNPGSTELIIQCFNGLNRAWIITNLYVYGDQATSNMFPVTCTQTGPDAYVVNSTPLAEPNLTMTINNGPNAGQTSTLDLTINSAAWQIIREGVDGCTRRWGCLVGSAQITY